MFEKIKEFIISVVLALLAFMKPIEPELKTLALIFFLNFTFGYLSGMIANREDFDLKKAGRCGLEAAVFFILCLSIFEIGQLKGQDAQAQQCVSMITYLAMYFYGLNVLKNLKKIFRPNTAAWYIVAFIYYILRIKWVEKIPFLSEFLNIQAKPKEL